MIHTPFFVSFPPAITCLFNEVKKQISRLKGLPVCLVTLIEESVNLLGWKEKLMKYGQRENYQAVTEKSLPKLREEPLSLTLFISE